MAYDAADSRIMIFGGEGAHGPLGDTWFYSGGRWSPDLLLGPAPSPRYDASMAYDPHDREVVLFGGISAAGVQGDTWVFAVGRWNNLTSTLPASPPLRDGSSIV